MGKKIYYADGYHGGVKGHMPFGTWSDIIHVFRQNDEWKISIEIEPISWEYLKNYDLESYYNLKTFLFNGQNRGRVEFVSGSYAQPYCWNINGESNIRQLLYGIRLNKEHFPDMEIDTYAVQEPCWSTALPQILLSLGFKRATLKNPATAWAGYSRGHDEGIVNWIGADGSSIPCVPRYKCEELVGAWATEAERMEDDFVEKCYAHGITAPVGSQYQDLGWPAGMNLGSGRAQYIIWREYFNCLESPKTDWKFHQEDILCTLPWGERHLQRLSRQVRHAENIILTAEKAAAFSYVVNRTPYPYEKLKSAWEGLMLSQHHDVWMCTTCREDRENWSFIAAASTLDTENICKEIIDKALFSFKEPEENKRCLNLFNPLSFDRDEIVSVKLSMLEKKRSVAVQDADGNRVQHQMRVLRVSDDGMIDAVELSFQAHVPAMGYSGYCMVFSDREDVQDGMITHLDDNYVRIETDIYRIRLDLNKGGTFESLYYKTGRREMCKEGEYAFHEVRGYFRREGKTLSNKDSRATAEILENGPLKSVISLSSAIGGHKLTTTLTVFKASERIDVSLRADFKEDEFIGAPYDIVPEESESQRIRSHHNSFRNLHPVFPINAQEKVIYKNAAFDVFKSKNDNTKFDSWDQIKHNIVVNWLDAYDEKTDVGMAIFSDHTTSYGLSKEYPLHLTFAWGGDAGFWWGKCPLRGKQEMNYSIVVHQGDWENSGMCRRSEAFNTPIIVKQSLGRTIQQNRSFINIGDDQVDVSAVYMENDFLYIRLFNHSARSTHTSVSFDFPYASAAFTELDGRYIGDFSPEITFRPFGFVTIKAALALSTGREV